MYIHLSLYLSIYLSLSIYIYLYIYIYTCIYMYVHIHTLSGTARLPQTRRDYVISAYECAEQTWDTDKPMMNNEKLTQKPDNNKYIHIAHTHISKHQQQQNMYATKCTSSVHMTTQIVHWCDMRCMHKYIYIYIYDMHKCISLSLYIHICIRVCVYIYIYIYT